MNPLRWDDQKSITLTKYLVLAIFAACVAATFSGPALVRWLMRERQMNLYGAAVGWILLALGYCCAALAFWMLCNLYQFLRRLEAGEVFVPQNVTALRRISWCCACAAALCLFAGVVIYLPFLFLSVAAGFTALLVRVIKNAFAQAVKMKNELDYTI